MGKHRSSSSSSSDSSSSDDSHRRRRKREKREKRERKKEKRAKERENREKTRRRSPSPVGKVIHRSSKLQDATAEIEAALAAADNANNIVAAAAVLAASKIDTPPIPIPQLIAPDTPSNSDIPVERLRIYVGNVNYAATEADVRAAFSRFGPLHSVSMPVDADKGHHRGFAFVEFTDVESVEKVSRMPPRGICFGGMPVRIAKPTIAGTGVLADGGSRDGGSGGSSASAPSSGSNAAPPPMDPIDIPVGPLRSNNSRAALAQQIAEMRGLGGAVSGGMPQPGGVPNAAASGSTPIYIDNLVRSVEEVDDGLKEEVRSECSKFGTVLHIEFYMNADAPAPTVAVEFSTAEAARQCTARMNGRIFDGRPLRSGLLTREFYERIK